MSIHTSGASLRRIALNVLMAAILLSAQSALALGADGQAQVGQYVQRVHVTRPAAAAAQGTAPVVATMHSQASAPGNGSISGTPIIVTSKTAPSNGLTIIPTFDSTITNDTQNAALIEATINQAIADYKNCFSDNITVNITFQEMSSGLGQSQTSLTVLSYSSYQTALAAHATTPDDTTALAHISSGATDTGTTFSTVYCTLANARALGLVPGPGGNPDGIIGLNTSICNLDSSQTNQNFYSLYAVACHEIDEVLGTASNADQFFPSVIFPADLFRYDSTGHRTLSSSSGVTSFFSLDGTTDLAQYNQTGGGSDYGDWASSASPRIQDAFGTPGSTPKLGVELRVLDAVGYTRNYPTITPATLPQGFIGSAYNQTLTVNNVTPPYAVLNVTNFSANGTGLPIPTANSGARTFSVTGTPTGAGTATFTVNATDFYGASLSQNYSITVPVVTVTPASLPDWTVNTAGYSQTISATGGTGAITLSLTAGAVPTGMTFTAATGVLNGTPTAAGKFNFTIKATDTLSVSGTRDYTININPAVTVGPAILPATTVNTAGYSQTISANGGTGAVTLSVSTGAVPTGMTFTAATGVLAGTPTVAGAFSFTIMGADSVGATGSQSYKVNVNNPAPALTGISPATASVGDGAFTLTLTGSNFVAGSVVQWPGQANLTPVSQSATQMTANVPASYLAAAGAASVTVVNSAPGGGTSAPQTFTVVSGTSGGGGNGAGPAITSALTATATQGKPFSYTITASGPGTIAFTAAGLPAGLSFSQNTISGAPTVYGQAAIKLGATNTAGADHKYLILTIAPAPGTTVTPPDNSSPPSPPDPTDAGQPVNFTAPVTTAPGSVVVIQWDFGDGTTGFGSPVSHTYAAPGIYNVTVTISDGITTITQTLDVPINSAGGVFNNAGFTVQKGSVKFNFASGDMFSISGALPIAAGFAPANKTVIVAIGKLEHTTTLTAKGKSKDNAFALTGRMKSGAFTAGPVKFSFSLRKQALFASLSAFGFTNADVPKPGVKVSVTVIISVDGVSYEQPVTFVYMAKKGKSGAGKK